VFSADGVARTPIDVSPEQAADLRSHTLLVFTGRSHFTPDVRNRVWDAYARGDAEVADALRAIRELTGPVRDALAGGRWEELATLARTHWEHQLRLDPAIRSPRSEAVLDALEQAGAWGWKGTGPGAGGCLVAFVPPERRAQAERAATDAGGTVLQFDFAGEGVAVWEREEA